MIDFIKKLKTGNYLRDVMNAVLEHLGVLQVIFNRLNRFPTLVGSSLQTVVSKDTGEVLLCVAYIFEISESSLGGTQSAAYRLCE